VTITCAGAGAGRTNPTCASTSNTSWFANGTLGERNAVINGIIAVVGALASGLGSILINLIDVLL